MQNIRKWSAFLSAGAVIFALAGCADRNKNGEPDSPATSSEITNSVDSAGEKMSGAASNAASAVSNAASNAAPAVKNAVSDAGKSLSNAAEAATMTPKVKAAILANNGLKNTNIDVDTLGTKDSIALRGEVKTPAQKALAGSIAKKNAPGYKIINQLTVIK